MQIRMLAFLLMFQSFVSCQHSQEVALPMAASIAFPSVDSVQRIQKKNLTTASNIVFQSVDGGQSWQDVSAGLPVDLPVIGVFTNGGEVFLGTENGYFRSNTAADVPPVWEKDFLCSERITAIYPGRNGPYFCSYGSGFYQEIPGTGIWTSLSNTLKDKTVHSVLETRDGTLFVGCDSGIFKSADAGQSWKQVFNKGMILNILESEGALIGGGRSGVLRSTDGGENWISVLNENILAKKTGIIGDRFVTILGTNDPKQVSPEGITNRLRTSADGGKTWQRMDQPLLPVQCIFDMDKSLSQIKDVYDIVQAGEYLFCSFDTGIFRSADQGKTWEIVFPSTAFYNLTVSGKVIYAVVGGGC